jgi:ubiquitin carboxyl-terminal hydrolase 14
MRAVTFPEVRECAYQRSHHYLFLFFILLSLRQTIDIFDFCCEELQQTLKTNRLRADKAFEASLGLGTQPTAASKSSSTSSSSNSVPETAVPADMDPDEYHALQAALQLSMDVDSSSSSSAVVSSSSPLGNCLPADFTGLFELHSLVTHKGRSADSGHYMGWVRQGPSSDLWWCFNDEKVQADVRTEDVLRLCGGGDRDIAYLTFYRYKMSKK